MKIKTNLGPIHLLLKIVYLSSYVFIVTRKNESSFFGKSAFGSKNIANNLNYKEITPDRKLVVIATISSDLTTHKS